MKRKLLTVLLTLIATLCLCCGLAACGGGSTEGTYYLVQGDEYDKETYFVLKNGEWTDEDGASGEYEVNGDKITLYTDMFGTKMEFTSGTIKDGVLTLSAVYGEKVFAKEGAWKGASGSGGNSSQTPAQKYTVTYDANGGKFASGDSTYRQTVKEGNKLTAPTSPTRKNYTFAGWAKSKNGSDMWKFDEDTVSSGITLWATWSQESAVILSVEGASIEGREIFMLVKHGTGEVSLSNMVVCSDDSIWRLYSDPEGQREIPTKMVTNLKNGDNTYYIVVNSQNQAQVNVYELTVHRSYLVTVAYYDGEDLLNTAEAYTGDEFTANYKPDISGYTFNGWKKGGSDFTSEVLWAPLSLYADKTANTYKVTLDVNKGDALSEAEKTLTYDKTYSLPVPKRTGYSFTGWYAGSTQLTNASGSSLSAWNYASAKQLTAHWEANDYAVTLQQNDSEAGTVSGGGDHAYDSQVTITATTNTGYNFLGWYDKDGELVSENAKYTFKMGFAVSYTAKWDYYTLTTTRNNTSAGTLSKYYTDEKVSVGTKVTLTAITNKGYTFIGWYKGDDEVSKDLTYQYTMTKENVSFEARWTLDPAMADFKFDSTPTTCTITGVNNTSKTEYIIPDYMTEVKKGAFSGCNSVQSMTIPFVGGSRKTSKNAYQYPFGYIFGTSKFDGASTVEQYYHESSTSSTTKSTYYIPNSLKKVTVTGGEILYGAFYNCNGLESITIPDSVTSIGDGAFYDCKGLTSVTIPDSMTSIGDSAFQGCSGLTEVYITDLSAWCEIDFPNESSNPLCYAHHLYMDNVELTELTIPDEITKIKPYAFYGCYGLTSIIIPDSVTSIGDSAFSGCPKLVEIWNYSGLNIVKGKTTNGRVAYYAKHVYTTDEKSKQTVTDEGYIFYENGEEIYLLGYSGNEKNLTLPTKSPQNKDYAIYQYAFYKCSSLESIIIPNGATSIGDYAFRDCSRLESVTIGSGVTSIGNYAFYGCGSLTSIEIPDGVKSIGDDAFYGCSSLTSIEIPDGVKSIGDGAFWNCSGLKSVTFSDDSKLTSIGHAAFENCSGLKSITIPDSVTSIGDYAFSDCSGLTSIIIPNGLQSIAYALFYNCSGLTEIQFKGTVKEWHAIEKNSHWNGNTGNYTITCTNGTIDKNGNVTYFEQ